jgi:hypothetical protein
MINKVGHYTAPLRSGRSKEVLGPGLAEPCRALESLGEPWRAAAPPIAKTGRRPLLPSHSPHPTPPHPTLTSPGTGGQVLPGDGQALRRLRLLLQGTTAARNRPPCSPLRAGEGEGEGGPATRSVCPPPQTATPCRQRDTDSFLSPQPCLSHRHPVPSGRHRPLPLTATLPLSPSPCAVRATPTPFSSSRICATICAQSFRTTPSL